jgi:anti-sigma B factor antagonist
MTTPDRDQLQAPTIVARDERDRSLVHVTGEVDVASAGLLKDTLYSVVDEGHDRVVVDTAEMSFIDSSGLGVLVGALKRVRERDGALVLRGLQPPARKVIDITGLDEVFTIED